MAWIGRLAPATLALAAGFALAGCGDRGAPSDPHVLRVGHFPNVTHAHGVLGHARTRAGKGWFEERAGDGTKVEWYVYNAGPSAMEAMLAGSLDLTYVGPSPALNAHVQTRGDDVRVVAGATRGGSALVVKKDGRIKTAQDFRGRRMASPQLGNTQDVSARAWLVAAGFKVTPTGGDVSVIPTPNPDQLQMLSKGDVDGVWTVEPWVSRLELEAGGSVLVDEPDTLTVVLVASARLLKDRPAMAAKFVESHKALGEWIRSHADEAKAELRAELKQETRVDVSEQVVSKAWARMRFEDAVSRSDFDSFVKAAQSVGFLKDAIPLDRLVAPPP
jgi:NitT/TauT family transport system substrate-binding protein